VTGYMTAATATLVHQPPEKNPTPRIPTGPARARIAASFAGEPVLMGGGYAGRRSCSGTSSCRAVRGHGREDLQ
jgi:hypothetical protein